MRLLMLHRGGGQRLPRLRRRRRRRRGGGEVRDVKRAMAVGVPMVLLGCLAVYSFVFASSSSSSSSSSLSLDVEQLGAERRLSGGGCSGPDIPEWQVFVNFVVILYFFLGLAIVVDEFFESALEVISERLSLSPDVAGATFLAAGSSAPELFTAIGDAFGPSNSIGLGTIVGSAMFNILVIVALSAAVASGGEGEGSGTAQHLLIDWRPVVRDVSFYVCSIGLLAIFFADGKIHWFESLVMILCYGIYIAFMTQNESLLARCNRFNKHISPELAAKLENYTDTDEADADGRAVAVAHAAAAVAEDGTKPNDGVAGKLTHGIGEDKSHQLNSKSPNGPAISTTAPPSVATSNSRTPSAADEEELHSPDAGDEAPLRINRVDGCTTDARRELELAAVDDSEDAEISLVSRPSTDEQPNGRPASEKLNALRDLEAPPDDSKHGIEDDIGGDKDGNDDDEDDDEDESRFEWPDTTMGQIMYVLSLPFLVAFTVTIPDCGKKEWEEWYVATFINCVLWIGLLCFIMVTFATELACFLGISPVVMGVLVLAVGTSVPDAIGSMVAARDGEADMAIANAVGSNVFDILLGLGLPWLARYIWKGNAVSVDTSGTVVAIIILACTVVLFLATLAMNRWRMSPNVGIGLFALYVVYVIWTITATATGIV